MKRKIAAILAADAPGYAGLLAGDRIGTLSELQTARRLFDEAVQAHDGRIFNTSGASVLAEFSSAVEAVRCALAVQGKLQALNNAAAASDARPARRLGFRIGLTIGDIVEHEGDLLGDGVNVAARLATLVGDGGICVSRSVYEQVRNKIDAGVVDLGRRSLKNLPEPVHALELRLGATGKMPVVAEPARTNLPALAFAGLAAVALLVAVVVNQVGGRNLAASDRDKNAALGPAGQAVVSPQPQQPVRLPNAASSALEFDKTKNSARCGEILELVQTGRATAEDRAALTRACQ